MYIKRGIKNIITMEIAILGILIILNGFFALSEIALVSCKKSKLEQLKNKGSEGAKISLELLENSENFLSAIQVGITLIGIITGVYGGIEIAKDIEPFFQNIEIFKYYSREISVSFTVIVITYISIVIGELVPKSIALGNPEKIAQLVAPIIKVFTNSFYPFVRLLSISTSVINKIIRIEKAEEKLTEEEIKQMMKIASHEGVIEKNQNVIHEKIFYFSDKRAKHLMTHRTDVEWVDVNKSVEEIKTSVLDMKHSKIVCCDGELDKFQGFIFLKEFYKQNSLNKDIKIKDLIVSPIITFENTDAQNILQQLKQNDDHICFVTNEYGGLEGIITLHDVMENIIGQISDENEIFEPATFIREDGSILVSGGAPVETLVDVIDGFSIDFDSIDYSTVAGFVFNHISKIPELGDHIEYLGYKIEIVDLDGNRIDKLLINKIES